MGAERSYPEEAPIHTVMVDGFWIDEHTITNAEFAGFVAATGYRTVAERPLDPSAYPGAAPDLTEADKTKLMHAHRHNVTSP